MGVGPAAGFRSAISLVHRPRRKLDHGSPLRMLSPCWLCNEPEWLLANCEASTDRTDEPSALGSVFRPFGCHRQLGSRHRGWQPRKNIQDESDDAQADRDPDKGDQSAND